MPRSKQAELDMIEAFVQDQQDYDDKVAEHDRQQAERDRRDELMDSGRDD